MPTRVCVAIVLLAQALFPSTLYGQNADWTPSEAELTRLRDGAVLVETDGASERSTGNVRAAVQISASAERIFRTLTDCTEALRFVPHLRHCVVLETAPDGSWQIVEQQIDYGWFMPHAYYVFRADYQRYEHIRVSNVRGDFRENRGEWQFRPMEDGKATLVIYRLHVVPRFFVPRWMIRNTLKRDLPELMKGLRASVEGQPPALAGPSAGQHTR